MDLITKMKNYLWHRQSAYLRVFDDKSEDVKTVMRDLSKFCRANTSTFHPDERMHAVAEGRREVWLRITQHLNLDSEELWNKFGREDKP